MQIYRCPALKGISYSVTRKFAEQYGDSIQWDQSNKNYILTHGVSGVDWRYYKHPLPDSVITPLHLKKKKVVRLAPSHCGCGDCESDKNESDKSEHDVEAGRRTLTCGRSCVADGVHVAVIAAHVDDAVDDGGGGVHVASGRVVP